MNTGLKFLCASALLLIGVPAIYFGKNQWVVSCYEPQITFKSDSWRSVEADLSTDSLSPRQQMIRDLIENVLPGKSREQMEILLGKSRTHEEMRRYTKQDFSVVEKDAQGRWKPYPRSGNGYYFDELDWDLIYPIGKEQILLADHKGQVMSADTEYLIVRLDQKGEFTSWYIEGSRRWPRVVGRKASLTYQKIRVAQPRSGP